MPAVGRLWPSGVNDEEDDDDAQGVRPDEGGRVEGCVQRVPGGGRVQRDASSLGSTVTGERSFLGIIVTKVPLLRSALSGLEHNCSSSRYPASPGDF